MSPKTIVIGGGNNALVLAAYLAKAGYKVIILESRDQVGGAAFTDTTTFPGFKISTFSYLNSLFSPKIVDDLELKRHGYEVLPRSPSSCTPLPSGEALLLGPDMAFNQEQIAQFSKRDAEVYPEYERQLSELGEWMARMMAMAPSSSWRDIKSLVRFMAHCLRLGLIPIRVYRLLKLLFTDPVKYLDAKHGGWFESDVLIATLITDALIGATKLSGYVLLHHVMGEAGGARGIWGYQRGGMGGISKALAAACKEYGVEIICNAHVTRIELDPRTFGVQGVWAYVKVGTSSIVCLTRYPADIVVSAINPTITFGKLLKNVRRLDDIRQKVISRDSESGSMKVNLTLRGLPDFKAMQGTIPGPQHQGTIHIAPSVQYVLDALGDYKAGTSSARPILEITIPSVVDTTLAPDGCHVMNIFVQFVRYDEDGKRYFRDVILPLMREYISNIDEIITGVQTLTPRDIERELGMVDGNIFHGGMGPDQLWWNRPARGIADYRVPGIKGLYLSGAGMHPGGGVSGGPGYNTAHVILSDIGS